MANGIASTRSPGLQVAPAAQIGGDIDITPGVQDFMQGFRTGFITVDDITKRSQEAVVRPSELELKQKQNEQGILDTETIRPQQRELASKQLDSATQNADLVAELARQKLELDRRKLELEGAALPSAPTVRATTAAQEQVSGETAAAITGTPAARGEALVEPANRAIEQAYVGLFGPLPATLPSKVKAAPFNTWLKTYHSPDSTSPTDEAGKFLAGMPAGPARDEVAAKMLSQLSKDPRIQADYQKYKEETAKQAVALTPDDPEYYSELRKQVSARQKELGVEAATLKALPGVLETRAKTAADLPAQLQKDISVLDTDMQKDDVLKKTRLQLSAVQQIRDLTNKPNPSNQDDLGLIYAVVRSLDPTSAVREGEISLLQKGVGLPSTVVQSFNRIFGNPNAVLTPAVRANLRSLGETQSQSAQASALPQLQKFYQRAEAGNLPLQQVFTDPELKLLISGGVAPGTTAVVTPIVAPVVTGASQKIQNGNLFERQPDGTYKFIRKI